MTPDAWIALGGLLLVQLSIGWSYTLKLETRLTNIEAALGINGKGRNAPPAQS